MQKSTDTSAKFEAIFGKQSHAFAYANAVVRRQPSTVSQGASKSGAHKDTPLERNCMSMSDCIKCWDTPCSCGYGYRHLNVAARIKQAAVVLGIDEKLLIEKIGSVVPEVHPESKK